MLYDQHKPILTKSIKHPLEIQFLTNQNQNRIPLKLDKSKLNSDKSKLNSILRLEFDIFTIMYLFLLKSL